VVPLAVRVSSADRRAIVAAILASLTLCKGNLRLE
jgi:hypothetical protein